LERGWGAVTFRMAQGLTRHGCFGKYLCRIRKERTTQCHHCGGDQDSAQHTLEECPAWAEERRVLVQVIGGDLSLPVVVSAIIRKENNWKEDNWKAFSSFCEVVMSQKEEAERIWRGEQQPPARGEEGSQVRGTVRRRTRPPSSSFIIRFKGRGWYLGPLPVR